MNDVNRLVAAAACGALAVVCVAATGEGAKQACSVGIRNAWDIAIWMTIQRKQ